MTLLNPYLNNGSLSVDDINLLERQLLFDFFSEWIITFELGNNKLKFSTTENLKDIVWEHYKDEPYWRSFQRYYGRRLVVRVIKNLIKKILKISK